MTLIVTRSHKVNDRDHVGLANGTASPEEHLPRYFAKSGFSANDNPNRIKKSGNGKGNWYVTQDYPFRGPNTGFIGAAKVKSSKTWTTCTARASPAAAAMPLPNFSTP